MPPPRLPHLRHRPSSSRPIHRPSHPPSGGYDSESLSTPPPDHPHPTHRRVRRSSRPFTTGDATLLSLSIAYSSSGDLPALDAFLHRLSLERRHSLPERLFLPILSCYSRLRLPSLALQLFDQLLPRFNISPSPLSLNTVLNALISSSLYRDALSFHSRASALHSIPPTLLTFNLLLKSLCRLGHLDRALLLFRDLPHRHGPSLSPDAYSYSTLMDALVRAGRLNEAAVLLDEMAVDGLSPHPATFNTLLRGLCLAGDFAGANRLLRVMHLKGCHPNIFTYNTLLHGLCSKNKFDSAIWLVETMVRNHCQPNEVTYATIIDYLARSRKVADAERLTETMECKGIPVGPFIYSALIKGFFEEGRPEEAIRKWNDMVHAKGVRPNVVLHTNLIDGLCRVGNVDEAERRFLNMIAEGCKPNVVTYSAMIRGYFKTGVTSKALDTWRDMVASGAKPTEVSYSILIDGFCQAGRLRDGMMVWRHMLRAGCEPDVVAYTSLIKGLCNAGRTRTGMRVFDDMVARGAAEPDTVAYNVLVTGLCRDGDLGGAVALVRRMVDEGPGCDPDEVTCNILVAAAGEEGKGREVLDGLARRLCSREKFVGATCVVEVMLRKGFLPERDTWEKVVRGVCRRRTVEL